MPVLYPSGDVDDIAGVQLLSCFAPLLVVASSGHTDQDLAAALISLVDVQLLRQPGSKVTLYTPTWLVERGWR